ncbi:excalibur calcium-binding domain-containing protein [Kitasatospora sp. NPDC088351]|uniref:excalibur calcium-binding domain-containing protein n=1 Tax=unclassified Kitasatospora TaxID=2633591 RepID=UPI00342B8F38
MQPYQPPSAHPHQRTPRNRLVRIALLIFLPPIAAVMTWRSRRVHVVAKVLLTVWCVFMSLFWIGTITGPAKKDTPAPVITTAPPSSSPEATPSDSPSPTAEPTTAPPEPLPIPTQENPAPAQENPAPAQPHPTAPAVAEAPRPAVTPAPETAPKSEPTAAPPAAYYKNCTEAKAAGAAPIYRGQPGYRPALDRDGDGIACEK